MTDEERATAEGRVLISYRNARMKLAVLRCEAKDTANRLGTMASRLDPEPETMKAACGASGIGSVSNPFLAAVKMAAFDEFPSADQLRRLAGDLAEAFDAKRNAEATLKELGIDLKD